MFIPELIILLPTKNEEVGVAEVIDRIPVEKIRSKGFGCRIVVVDGNSSDSTCKVAKSKGAEIINQRGEVGKGNGVRQAINQLKDGGMETGDLLVMLDADATYSPEVIPEFIDLLGEADVAWGSRIRGNIGKGAMTRTNLLGNKILSFLASIVFLKRTSDLCTGYWGFRSETLRNLPLSAKGFTLEADIFGSVAKSAVRTVEIPIDYSFREGETNLKWYSDGPRILMMIIRKRFFG